MRSKSEELMLRIREYIESYFERYSSTPPFGRLPEP